MISSYLSRRLATSGALIAAIAIAGTTAAATPPSSSHASSTAVAAVAAGEALGQDAHALAVSTAAGSDTVGGAHQNHGGYVSCIARGGSDCTSTTPTLPTRGQAPVNPKAAPHRG